MILPSKEVLELHKIIKNGTETEVLEAYKRLEEISQKRLEEEKKNPPPWGNLML